MANPFAETIGRASAMALLLLLSLPREDNASISSAVTMCHPTNNSNDKSKNEGQGAKAIGVASKEKMRDDAVVAKKGNLYSNVLAVVDWAGPGGGPGTGDLLGRAIVRLGRDRVHRILVRRRAGVRHVRRQGDGVRHGEMVHHAQDEAGGGQVGRVGREQNNQLGGTQPGDLHRSHVGVLSLLDARLARGVRVGVRNIVGVGVLRAGVRCGVHVRVTRCLV